MSPQENVVAKQAVKEVTIHRIVAKDTLTKISKKYGVTIDSIVKANPTITNINRIYAGKTIIIPGKEESIAQIPTNRETISPIPSITPVLTPDVSQEKEQQQPA